MTKLNADGTPDEVLRALGEHMDTTALVMGNVAIDAEKNFSNTLEWDSPPLLFTCYRDLPPAEIADDLSGLGIQAMMVKLRNIPLPPQVWAGDLPLYQVLAHLAEHMSLEDEHARRLLGGQDLFAWMLVYEAWETIIAKEDVVWGTDGKPVESKVRPRDDPNHVEVRLLSLVDRAGYRFTVQRRRDTNEVSMLADQGPSDDQHGMSGRLMDSLQALMDATPERVV